MLSQGLFGRLLDRHHSWAPAGSLNAIVQLLDRLRRRNDRFVGGVEASLNSLPFLRARRFFAVSVALSGKYFVSVLS